MADSTTRWWLIRHAPVHAEGRLYGQQDLGADVTASANAAALAAVLPERPAWLTTPLQRTHQTARAIAAHLAAPPSPTVEADFAEQHFGLWQGRTPQELMRDDAAAWRQFWQRPGTTRPPGGESFADVVARVAPALERHAAAHGDGDVVAVVHGGTVRAALAVALELPPERALAFVVDTWSLTRLDRIPGGGVDGGPSWRIVSVNERPTTGR